MSLLCEQVAVQNGDIQEVDSLLISVPFCGNTTVMPSDKVTDTGTGSKAHKILQYGSRHTIQNTGWTTRLSCDPSARRNQVPSVQKLPLPPMSGKSFKPLCPRLPFISVSKPTIVKLQPPTAAAETGIAFSVSNNHLAGLQSTASSVAQCTVTSGCDPLLRSILAQPHVNASALSCTSSAMNQAVLTMPTVDSHATVKPTTVCFIPVSSVLCAPVTGLPADVHVIENVASPFAMTQAPTSLVGVHKLNLGPLLTQPHATNESKTVVTNAAMKPLSSASVLSAKEIVTWTSNGQVPSVRMLTMKVHIDHGHITEVTEVPQKQTEPRAVPGLLRVHLDAEALTSAEVSGAAVASQKCMDHVDTNGAQFGYHDLTDGSRIRIARDTNGQRHAPLCLLPKDDNFCRFEECTVELTSTKKESRAVPEEADVSEVGTVFTYEPLFVSEQTLMPFPKKKIRPYDSTVCLSEDESDYYYRCYLCSFISDDHAKVCKHWVNVHLTELPYRCPYCERTFFTSTKAQVHVQRQHKDLSTTIAFQRSRYFVNTMSYQLGETDNSEGSDSDEGEEEQQIVLEQCGQQHLQQRDSAFGCQKCRFKTRSSAEMRQHVKFIHGHGHFTLIKPGITQRYEAQNNNAQLYATSHLLRAEIAWSNIAEKLNFGGERWFRCRWCAFQAKDASAMSVHVLQDHNWPAAVLCPSCSCNLQLTDDDRRSTSVVCCSCKAKILLAAGTEGPAVPQVQDMIFMCNICAFKTWGKGSMCRHIKYNHTKCRPFTCVYCNYVAVERAQVKMHIANHHPDQSVIIKERTEASDQFRYILESLFPKLVSVQTSEAAGLRLNEDSDGAESDNGKPVPSSDVDSPFFTCEECKLETSSLEQLIRHQHRFHKSILAANAAMVPAVHDEQSGEITAHPGEHFKCKICGYCSLDRSCMSRHVKYMHITARPHSCMYCSYNNVEKTKVRLHIMAHHPGRPKTVRTDYKILEEMSWQAKHFYIQINHTGQIVDESTSSINKSSSSPIDRPSAASLSSSDSELPEDLLTAEQSELSDIRVSDNDPRLVMKEKSLADDDDVDIDFYPRRNRVDDVSLNSVMLDHNYVRILTPDNHTSVTTAHNASVVIKHEPLDVDYKDGVSDMLHCSSYLQPENDGHQEVKNEITDDFFSAVVNSPDSLEMSESDSDDFYDSEENSVDSTFDSEHSSDHESCSNTGEPVRKKIRVSFGVDPAVEESMTVRSVIIESDVWEDPKIHMTPVVELEDVLQIILAWQQNISETDDIM